MPSPDQADTSVQRVLFAHHTWANLKLLEFCEALSEEQFVASATGTYGPIVATLCHIVMAEVDYAQRVNGKQPPVSLVPGEFPGFAALKEAARWSGDELSQLAQATRAENLVEEHSDDFKTFVHYPLASLLMQAINHATEHRTQISTIITQLGLEPPDMSGWQYMDEMGEFHETTAAES
jgi:uncharacterized damage-inducible protein DinB